MLLQISQLQGHLRNLLCEALTKSTDELVLKLHMRSDQIKKGHCIRCSGVSIANETQDPGRIACYNGVRRNISCDNAARAHYRILADPSVGENRSV